MHRIVKFLWYREVPVTSRDFNLTIRSQARLRERHAVRRVINHASGAKRSQLLLRSFGEFIGVVDSRPRSQKQHGGGTVF
jgi:hypothetical protein